MLLAATAGAAPETPVAAPEAAVITLEGAIGPASSAYFEKALAQATARGARLVVLRIDTPGGLDGAMRDIIKDILASPIPVVGFVGPGGARAASAGTFILYATHVAAMAPATNLGSATPVPIGGGMPTPARPGKPETAEPGEDPPAEPAAGDAMQKKILNDAVAYIRGLAEQRGRNADWAEQAVREGVNLTASEALAQNVIDLVAADVPALLAALDGRSVRTSAGELRLETAGLVVREIEPDWRFRLLSVLASPTIAYVLLLVGVYGLLLEGYNPGAILPGVVGAISLLFALFALQVLPVNYVGLALMALGLALLVTEALVPSFGVLGFGGIVAFVFGSVLLMDTDVPGYGVNLGLIAGLAIGASLLMALTLYLLARSRRQPVVTGDALQIGQTVVVSSFAGGQGIARLGGEIWRIRSSAALAPGSRARVVAIDGLVLQVEPLA